MVDTVYEAKFGVEQLAAALNLREQGLQYLLAQYSLPLSTGVLHPGRGQVRQFTYTDIIAIGSIVELEGQVGLSLQRAIELVSAILTRTRSSEGIPFDKFRKEGGFIGFAFNSAGDLFVEQFPLADGSKDVHAHFADEFAKCGNEAPQVTLRFDFDRTVRRIDFALSRILGQPAPRLPSSLRGGRRTLASHMKDTLRARGIEPLDRNSAESDDSADE